MKKLGIHVENDMPSFSDIDAYARLFDHPLSTSHIAALAALFGWTVPSNGDAGSAEALM